jgi:hypothetical protein
MRRGPHQRSEPCGFGELAGLDAKGDNGDLDRLWPAAARGGRLEVDDVERGRLELLVVGRHAGHRAASVVMMSA